MKFKIGQKVVANTSKTNAYGIGIIKDKIYTISQLFPCPKCKTVFYGLGLPIVSGLFYCAGCEYAGFGPQETTVPGEYLEPLQDIAIEEKTIYRTRIVDVEIDRRLHIEAKKYLALCN
jgi:hypothetical protein